MTNSYVVLVLLAGGLGTAGVIALRWRKSPDVDHVSPTVLDRIRSEYQ